MGERVTVEVDAELIAAANEAGIDLSQLHPCASAETASED